MKDIGSIFPIYEQDFEIKVRSGEASKSSNDRIDFSLCREAIYAIAKKHSNTNKKVLLPAYTCQTVIDPFKAQDWTCHYYNICKDLSIDIASLAKSFEDNNPSVVLVHPYLGMELSDNELKALNELKEKGCILVEDLTQCIFSSNRNSFFNYFIGSYRKWIQVPDGGYLESDNLDEIEAPVIDYSEFVSKQTDAMYLRGQYFQYGNEQLKSISIRLNKDAVNKIDINGTLHKMSDFSRQLWRNTNFETIKKRRISNYDYLYSNIRQSEKICFVTDDINRLTTAPLYFPIYVIGRSILQKKLADNHIYAPVLWPVSSLEVLINDNIKFIYDSILMLPIDQRYDESDMNRIIEIVNSYE